MQQRKNTMATRTLAYCAMLAALSVALARLFGLMPEESARFSIEAIPIFTAGMLFGPLAGGLVGFAADFVGCLFSPFGFNPLFCVPPILYGVFGGVSAASWQKTYPFQGWLSAFCRRWCWAPFSIRVLRLPMYTTAPHLLRG